MEVQVGTSRELGSELFQRMARYRYRVFVERLGWNLPATGDLEYDQFDHDNTLYLVAKDGQGHLIGTARLLPTTQSYLLERVFPQLLAHEPPRSSAVWELSRFAAMDVDASEASNASQGQFSSLAAIELLRAAIDAVKSRGGERIITVSPAGVERLLRLAGFVSRRAGPVRRIHEHLLVACEIECARRQSAASERRVRLCEAA